MEITKNILQIENLISYWEKQNIRISPANVIDIENVERKNDLVLPEDFKVFYKCVNGMGELYPNYTDSEGFLFYPVEKVFTVKKGMIQNKNILVFSEYMHGSWWYGLELIDNSTYRIGIIPDINCFKIITDSLANFIELYLKDSPVLYDYS